MACWFVLGWRPDGQGVPGRCPGGVPASQLGEREGDLGSAGGGLGPGLVLFGLEPFWHPGSSQAEWSRGDHGCGAGSGKILFIFPVSSGSFVVAVGLLQTATDEETSR